MGPGSPLRYYAPAVPLIFAATTATLIDSWRTNGDKRMIVAAGGSTAAAAALSAYLVRTVNLRLVRGDVSPSSAEGRRLIKTWHRANLARLVALVGASLALPRATRRARIH